MGHQFDSQWDTNATTGCKGYLRAPTSGSQASRSVVTQFGCGPEKVVGAAAIKVALRRITSTPTGSAVATIPYDDMGHFWRFYHVIAHAEPTVTGNPVLSFCVTHRQSFNWQVPEKDGIVVPERASGIQGLATWVMSVGGTSPGVPDNAWAGSMVHLE